METLINKLKKRKILLIILLLISIGGFFFIQNKNKNDAKKSERSATVKKGNLQETLILSGEIQSQENTKLRFYTGGKISSIKITEGDIVRKGQLIASLDQRDLQKRLSKELNDYMTTRWDFEAEKDSLKDKAVTTVLQRALDQSQFSLNNSVLDVELQSIALEYANLFSPIQGIVTNVGNIQPGVIVSATDTIATIVNPDLLYFEVTADQSEVTKLHQNMSGKLRLDAYIDETIPASITTIGFSPKEGESSTVYSVQLAFSNKSNQDLKYRLGMTGDIEFVLAEKKETLYIPTEFIQNDNKGAFVYVMRNNKKEKKYVKIGLETDSSTEIIEGLSEGDVVYDQT